MKISLLWYLWGYHCCIIYEDIIGVLSMWTPFHAPTSACKITCKMKRSILMWPIDIVPSLCSDQNTMVLSCDSYSVLNIPNQYRSGSNPDVFVMLCIDGVWTHDLTQLLRETDGHPCRTKDIQCKNGGSFNKILLNNCICSPFFGGRYCEFEIKRTCKPPSQNSLVHADVQLMK